MDEKVWGILFANVKTLEEAYRLDDELRLIQQESFLVGPASTRKTAKKALKSDDSLAEKSKSFISHVTYQRIKELEDKGLVVPKNQDDLRNFFELAHKQIMETPRLQLQVAHEINAQILGTLYAWVRRELKGRVFLDVVVKPQILAGCIIVYRGIFRDYTLRTVLRQKAAPIFRPILEDINKRLAS